MDNLLIRNASSTRCCWLVLLMAMFILSIPAYSSEKIIYRKPSSESNYLQQYPVELLNQVLIATEDEYGKAEVVYSLSEVTPKRRLKELIIGKNLHVTHQAISPVWEQQAIPVYIPIRKGILGFRVFLIKKSNSDLLANITTLAELRKILTGSGTQWAITRILKANNFNLVTSVGLGSLSRMLLSDRFSTINSSIAYYSELEDQYTDLAVDQHVALFTLLPSYFFVTPEKPELAERISKGLLKLIVDGSFEKLFLKYHQPILDSAHLNNRKIFRIQNSDLSDKTLKHVKEFWYQPMSKQ